MKKIIDGKVYNTETAELLGEYWYLASNDFRHVEEALYITKKGNYFLYYCGGALSKYAVSRGNNTGGSEGIEVLFPSEAKNWAMKNLDADKYISIFGEIEEA